MKVLVVLGSARQNGLGDRVGKWVQGVSAADTEHETEVVSVAELNLPLFNENFSPKYRHYTGSEYTNAEGKAWAERVAGADAFVFVTPEYNHSIPAALKNALDWVGGEWADKPVGFVGYSITQFGGVRAVEHLRQIAPELGLIQSRQSVLIGGVEDTIDVAGVVSDKALNDALTGMLEEVKLIGGTK